MKYKEITILRATGTPSPIFQNVLNAINAYLIRNFGAVNDFNIIKDVVERTNKAKDSEINSIVPLPIYLGLGGTMFGIILGLLFMPDVSSEEFDGAINMLVSGVSMAMFTSIFGLIIMVRLTLKQKQARVDNEESKNNFYTFIQTELMPVLTDTSATSAVTMQRNLNKFNREFGQNIRSFEPIMEQMLSVSKDQTELMVMLKDQDLVGTAKMNIQLIKTVETSANNFKNFTSYIQKLNTYLEGVRGDMDSLINDRKSVIGAVAEVDMAMKDAILELKRATENQVTQMEKIITDTSMPFEDFNRGQIESVKSYMLKINEALQMGITDLQKHTQIKLEEFNEIVKRDQPAFNQLVSMQQEQNRVFQQGISEISRSIGSLSEKLNKPESSKKSFLDIFDNSPSWVKYSALGVAGLFTTACLSVVVISILLITSK